MQNTKVFDISLPHMKAAFEKMKTEAMWNVNINIFWGYYFLDHDMKKLKLFGKKLQEYGLQNIAIKKVDEDDFFLLHVEERAIHSPESLYEKCQKLAKTAASDEIEIFDGWDAGQISMANSFNEN